MEATIWAMIAEKGFNVAFMAVFCYLVWKHFTGERKSEREWLLSVNRELRLENKDLTSQLIEMNKLIVETSMSLLHQQRDVITIISSVEEKVDKLIKKPSL